MGLCASRALGELTELEEEEIGHDEDCRSCLQIDHQSGAGDGGGGDGVQMTSRSSSSSSSRRSNNSGNSSSLVKAALSFDSSRSSAEVGDMGKLGALFCKRRPFVGSPDILSAHLTNLLSSLVRSSSSVMDRPQQELQLLANAAEISFSSYLSKSFIRPHAAAAAGFQQEHASAAGTRDAAALDAIAKSYAESAAKAAARDTLLFLKENDTLQGYALTSCCVPEELDDSKGLDQEDAEEEEEKATSETTHQTVDLFRPGGLQYQQTEKDLAVGDVVAAQRSLFEFCFPATSTSSRWASVVNAARQSACLAATFRPLQQQLQAGSSVQGDVVLEQKLEGKQQQKKKKKKTLQDLVPPLHDAAAYSSKLDQNLLRAADAAGAKVMCRSDDEDSRDQRGCLVSCPTSCCSCLQINSLPSPGKKCSENQCNSSSSMCDSPSLEDHHHHQEGELEEEEEDDSAQDDPADRADQDSFFSFPSSPSSKLFEEMGSGHIIEQMKFTKLMQEIACQRKIVEEFHAGILQNFEDKPRSSSCEPPAETPPPPFSSRPSGNGFQGSECAASQQLLTHEEDSRVAPQQQQPSFDNNKNLNLFAIRHQQDCNTNTCHAVGAPAVSTNRFAGLELLANTEEDDEDEDEDDDVDDEDDDSSDTHAREYGEHDGNDNESSCELFNIDEDHAQGMRIMSLMGKDFACLQMIECFNAHEAVADLMTSSGTATAAHVGR
jgi:hypothetical protein